MTSPETAPPCSRTDEPLGIYVHVPFCEQKCAYCDFFTVTDPDRAHPLYESWLQLCARELQLWRQQYPQQLAGRQIGSIFFGGGTPSLLRPTAFGDFLTELKREFDVAPDVEVSLETQPATIAPADYAAMVHNGINRFSVGAQTFQPRLLQPTARRHTVEETRRTLELARATGVTLSLDLICALPGQTMDEWRDDLATALSYDPHHVSVYEMTYHAGTQYYRQWRRGAISETDEAMRIAMYTHTRNTMMAAGYEHYEISNYALPGRQSRHNRVYWRLGDFVGLGAGAHSYLGGHRYANPRSADDYARAVNEGRLFARPQDSDDPDITLVENLTMALRLLEGVDLDWLADRVGEDIRVTRRAALEKLSGRGWITVSETHLHLTENGILQADSVAEGML